jgi:hypothetical protein
MKQWHKENGVWLYGEKRLTATPAIHQYCMNKCCNTAHEVTKCENRNCELWGFRTGKSLNTRQRVTHQSKDDSGKYLTVNSGKKSKPVDVSKKIMTLDDREYELVPIAKQKDSK